MNDIRTLIVGFFLLVNYTVAETPIVNVYVHGTQQFGSKLLPRDIWYCKKGLHHVSHLPDSSMMVKDAQLLQEADGQNFDIEHYYTFGWSGALSFEKREQAGKKLYHTLTNLLENYKKQYGLYPKVRIITFSHGGNVALNMVKHLPFMDDRIALELVLIACPVQKITEHLINHPSISKSCIMYSTFDLLQVADYYTYDGWMYFPKRTFATDRSTCSQVLVSVNGKTLSHTELLHSFMRHVPEVLNATTKNDTTVHYTKYNISDAGFLFYNGFNIFSVLTSARKK